jgi:hypothetical protein
MLLTEAFTLQAYTCKAVDVVEFFKYNTDQSAFFAMDLPYKVVGLKIR